MQFDGLRAFPYPVLRPDVDDYIDGGMQVIIDFSTEDGGETITADVVFQLNVQQILDEVTKGRAKYTVVIACRDTYFRHVHTSENPEAKIEFKSGELKGEIHTYAYVATVEPINDYTCPWVNEEFGDGPFSYPSGSILAISQPQENYLDREAFRPLQTIFLLVVGEKLKEHECRIVSTDTKVHIEVSETLKEKIDIARNNLSHKAVLMNSIYFGAVMQCVVWLQKDDGDGQKWAEIIKQRCDSIDINYKTENAYSVTDKLLQHPIQMVDTYLFSGGYE